MWQLGVPASTSGAGPVPMHLGDAAATVLRHAGDASSASALVGNASKALWGNPNLAALTTAPPAAERAGHGG